MKYINRIIAVFFVTLLIASCSDYQRILKSPNFDEKYLFADREFKKGNYSQALGLYEQIYQRYPRTEKGELAFYRTGLAYYLQENYTMAIYYFSQFTQRFPSSKRDEKATFYTAMCSVKESPKATLDQTDTQKALIDLQTFVQEYPNSSLVDSCNKIMDRLHLRLETKDFDAVKLYHRMEDYRAAVVAAKTFLENYPQSHYLEPATHILYQDAYWLAMKSVLSKKKERIQDALDVYSKYNDIFKKQNYAKRAEKRRKDLEEAQVKVAEQYAFNDIKDVYNQSNTSSRNKKVKYLKETIKKFDTFAKNYPNSDLLEKAAVIKKRADKELNNINKD